ncbi:MAG: methyltransferase [Cyclobacteriaceae bacterium]|nr:methyltransferase [Cyclobacteriaceae bacterium]
MKKQSILEAKYEAQKLAFAPYYFQVVVTLRKTGILTFIHSKKKGVSIQEIVDKFKITEYGVRTLLEAAESAGIVDYIDENNVVITKVGYLVNFDQMTGVNINFMNDVCYDGAKHLTQSIQNDKPEGLKELGNWDTIYEGLSQLPDQIKKSWFEFDHFYSDDAFPYALPIVFEDNPNCIFDIGGNTGKWSFACCEYNPNVKMKIFDLPGQINVAKANAEEKGYLDRIDFYPIDLLDATQKIPKGADVVWMSQFLDCFSETEIITILKNVHQAIDSETPVYILETFVDNQKFEAAKYSLTATSLYFTTMANGNSKMYRLTHMRKIVDAAGFDIVIEYPLIGNSYHTILKCVKRK